jgi:hypothetical protein
VRERYGLNVPSFTMKAWKITDRNGKWCIRHVMDQDYIHCGKKLVNCMNHPTRSLCMGPGLYPHFNSVTMHMDSVRREIHGLNKGDDTRDQYMAMDWPSVCRLTSPKHLDSMRNLCEGHNDLAGNESVRGTMEYLKLCRLYVSIFADKTLPHIEHVRRAGEVCTYLRLWSGYVKSNSVLKKNNSFITREAYQDALISCHCAVIIIMVR